MKHTSRKLSKLLAENGFEFETEYFWVKTVVNGHENYDLQKGNKKNLQMLVDSERGELKIYKAFYPAYDILNDLCVKYAVELFGEYPPNADVFADPTIVIFSLLKLGKQDEAEAYLWENCLFNPKNK